MTRGRDPPRPQATGAGGDYRVPWLARNIFVRPGLTNIDFRVCREFRITERNRLELLVEAFNLFNHTNASGVYGNAFNLSGTTLTARTDFLSPTGTSNYYYRERMIQMSARFRF